MDVAILQMKYKTKFWQIGQCNFNMKGSLTIGSYLSCLPTSPKCASTSPDGKPTMDSSFKWVKSCIAAPRSLPDTCHFNVSKSSTDSWGHIFAITCITYIKYHKTEESKRIVNYIKATPNLAYERRAILQFACFRDV